MSSQISGITIDSVLIPTAPEILAGIWISYEDGAGNPNGAWKEKSGESTNNLVDRLVSYMLAPFAVFFSSQTASLGLEA